MEVVTGMTMLMLLASFHSSSARYQNNEQAFKDELEAFLDRHQETSMENDDSSMQNAGHFNTHLTENEDEEDVKLKRALRTFFECRKAGAACGGVVPCCGQLKCFWSQGYSMLKEGKCVECVGKNNQCQRSSQCCQGMVCHKSRNMSLDGRCGSKRKSGETCHGDKQCESGECKLSMWEKVSLKEGSCA